MNDLIQISYSLGTIDKAAYQLSQCLHRNNVLCFSAEMGAGKTTLISALCKLLEVRETVSSPTFSLINEYSCIIDGKLTRIFHMDLYRLQSVSEAINAGVEDCLRQPGSISLVEWPQKFPELITPPYTEVILEVSGLEERNMTIQLHH